MATYEYLDQVGLQYTLNKLKTALNSLYVAKEAGKGLSTNDLTNELLTKLNGIAAGATATSASSVLSSGVKVATITINGVDTDIYVEQGQSITIDSAMSDSSTNPVQNKVIKSYVDNAIAGVTSIEFVVVSQLPATGQKGKIYLVPHSGGSGTNTKDEYIWIEETIEGVTTGRFEKIGSTDIDLSNYVQKTDLGSMTTSEIDTVFEAVFPSN